MLTVGDKIPSLVLPVQQGIAAPPAGETIDLGRTEGRWKLIFYWPKDFTFVCPTEVVAFGELRHDFEQRATDLIGASTDSAEVHYAWRKSDEQLASADFPWIADEERRLAQALGILEPHRQIAYRATFIIDPANVIQHVTVNSLNVGRNPVETLRVLDALLTEELCPCNWTEGEATLGKAA